MTVESIDTQATGIFKWKINTIDETALILGGPPFDYEFVSFCWTFPAGQKQKSRNLIGISHNMQTIAKVSFDGEAARSCYQWRRCAYHPKTKKITLKNRHRRLLCKWNKHIHTASLAFRAKCDLKRNRHYLVIHRMMRKMSISNEWLNGKFVVLIYSKTTLFSVCLFKSVTDLR